MAGLSLFLTALPLFILCGANKKGVANHPTGERFCLREEAEKYVKKHEHHLENLESTSNGLNEVLGLYLFQ